MTGSQTALEECRRAWDLQPKISTTENTEYQQDPPSKALDA